VLVSKKSENDDVRWVYLDIGKFGGLAETMDESIRYPIRTPRDGDVGAVFGIGFPPFRGGPFRYMDSLGIQIVVQRLEDLNARFPGRFEPAELLLDMARRRQVFYPDERS